MTDRVLIPLPGVGTLALSSDEFAVALERGKALLPNGHAEPAGNGESERLLLTAEQLEERTSVPATWWAEAARQGRVPHRLIGRYPRFAWAEIVACEAFKGRSA